MSATRITYNLIEMLLKDCPDTLAGMKDSSSVLDNVTGVVRNFPGFHVLSGADDLLLQVLEAGGAGAIAAYSNVCSASLGSLHDGFRAGRDVSALNGQVSAVRYTRAQFPLQSALKQLIARHTGDECWLRLRPPLMQMSDERGRELCSTFDAIGYDLPAAA